MLFNKDDNGAVELHELTGVYCAANNFDSIAGEIADATREVGNIVGAAIITRAEEKYVNNAQDDIVRHVQLPIACLAISRYFRSNTVAHDDIGRSVALDESRKIPFEWMLDRDDRAMREKYYRALDALFAYLEDAKVPEWQDSSIRKNLLRSIIPDIHTFESVYPIEQSRYTFFMLLPLILEVQETRLQRLLGDAWERIIGETVLVEDLPLRRMVQKAVVLYAVIIAVERWSIEVFPQSIARRFSPTYQGNKASANASISEIEWYLSKLRDQAAEAIQEIHAISTGGNQYSSYPLLPDNDRNRKFFTSGL